MKTRLMLLFAFMLFAFMQVKAHEGHKKKTQDSTATQAEHVQGDTVHHHDDAMAIDKSKVTADLDDFPSLHPLIVHFAISLIIIAAAIQLLNLILVKKEITWIITAILLIGVGAAWFAGKNFHPHTHGISDHAKMVLEQHDKWADWTINTGLVALALQIANLFVFKGKRWAMSIVAAILVVSAYSVSRAGHYGAQLVHIEGIGPQGKYLEMEHHHH
ncbi:MAG: hypothetical protein ABI663_07080 [Chryseolinea sp.]